MRNHWILSFALLTLVACSKHGDSDTQGGAEPAPPTPVQVAVAKQQTVYRVITAQAVLYPVSQATIVPKISAPVARFFVQRGDHVRKGQVVATLENRDLAAAEQESKDLYEQARASLTNTKGAVLPEDATKAESDLSAAKQALDTAELLYKNRVELVREGALAQKLADDANVALAQARSAYDLAKKHMESLQTVSAQSQLTSAEAQAAAAKAHYEGSAAQVSYSEVRSPISGVVSDRPLNVGEMASSGTALLSVVDLSKIVARANVPINEAALVKAGTPATIAGPGGDVEARVIVVSPAVDPNTTTIQVWVQAANPDETLRPGATVQISIQAGAVPHAVVIPVTALLSNEDGGEKVMLAGADGLAHEENVKTGVRSGDSVQILDGVKPGEKVITEGALGLDNKAKITLGESTEPESK